MGTQFLIEGLGEELRRQALSLGLGTRSEKRKGVWRGIIGRRRERKEKRLSKWEICFSEKEKGWMKSWNLEF